MPDGATVIFSAHGVSSAWSNEAARAGSRCSTRPARWSPRCTWKCALRARRARRDADRPRGPSGGRRHDGPLRCLLRRAHASGRKRRRRRAACRCATPQTLAFVTQTTLSVDDTAAIVAALRKRFPMLATPRKDDICYATQNRQDAVKKLLEQCDVLIVVGSPTSSNSNRLRELADRAGMPAI